MDIRCPGFHRPLQDQVDQADDRRLGGQVPQVFDILEIAFIIRIQVLDDLPHGAAAAAHEFLDAIFNFRCNTHLGNNIFPARHLQRLAGKFITRIGHHHGQVTI